MAITKRHKAAKKLRQLAMFFPSLARGHSTIARRKSRCIAPACKGMGKQHSQSPRECAEKWLASHMLEQPVERALRNAPTTPAGFQRLRKQTPGTTVTPSGTVVIRRRRKSTTEATV